MATLNGGDIADLFHTLAAMIEREKDHLSALDGVIGDGDHGVTMSIGFQAVDKALASNESAAAPSDVFMLAAKTFLNAVGASAGPLYATGFMRAAASTKGKDALTADDVADVIGAIAEGIVHRGKAEVGQKTMVDAWQPAAQAALAAKGSASLASVGQAAAKAAKDGADATAAMTAGKGRSANLGERAVGHVDPGAASAALLLETLAQWAGDKDQ